MKLQDFLLKIPQSFVVECLEALPGVDRRRLLQAHRCRVKMGPSTLKRKDRMAAEARKLHKALLEAEDLEDKRSLLQGWLARRSELIVALLDSWEVEHNGGFVDDFEWTKTLEIEKVRASIEVVQKAHPELATPVGLLAYFAYLELAFAEQLFDLEQVFAPAS